MTSNTVSTKLNIDEYERFLKVCKENNCVPSTMIKTLILDLISNTSQTNAKTKLDEIKLDNNKKIENKTKSETLNELAKTTEDKIALEIIKRLDDDELTYETLHEIYNKLNEKYEHGGLTRMEEILFRKVHRQLREKIRERPEIQRMSLDERFQYF